MMEAGMVIIGFSLGGVLAFIGLWHLRFPPRDNHVPKSWFEVYRRIAIGVVLLVIGMSLALVSFNFWLAS